MNELEFNERLIKLFESLKIHLHSGQVIYNSKASKQQVTEMFALHNSRFQAKEFGSSCSACINRVFTKMKTLYEKIIIENERS
jgi:hypothetical protein